MMATAKLKEPAAKKLPGTIGAAADMIYELRAKRLDKAKEVEAIKKDEQDLEEHIIALLESQNLKSGRGKVATVTISQKDTPALLDYEKFAKYLKKTGNVHLLQKRLATTAIKEMMDDGQKIPGVELLPIKDLSITKAA
jgi:NADPH-dependent 7-cyano-7-deazaguanine reductase QueF